MYRLYRITNGEKKDCDSSFEFKDIYVSEHITAKVCGGGLKGIFMSVYWNLISLNKAKAYYIKNVSGELIHISIVLRKCRKFNFLTKTDIEIGPCKTDEKYRGMNIYPYVLCYIISNEIHDNGYAYMIVEDSNIPSINGIKKVGFYQYADVVRQGKRYLVNHD